MKPNLNYGTFTIRTESYYGTSYTSAGICSWNLSGSANYRHPAIKSAADSAGFFKSTIRLTPNQLLADSAFLALARAAVESGKSYTSELLEWEDKATVKAAVAQLAEGLARKAARKVDTRVDPLLSAPSRRAAKLSEYRQWQTRLQSASSIRSMSGTSTGTFRSGPVLVTVKQTECCDWNRYSKSWHRAHGPYKTVATSVTLERWDGITTKRVVTSYYPPKLQHIDRRVMEYVASFLRLPKLRGKVALRIDSHVELIAEQSPNRHTQVYRRELCGEVLGFVAVRRGTHYHDSSINSAVSGVLTKLAHDRLGRQQRAAGVAAGIDTDKAIGTILRGFGFCRDGVADALDTLGLEDRRYTLAELVVAGEWSKLPVVARKYPKEVATLRSHLVSIADLPASVAALIG